MFRKLFYNFTLLKCPILINAFLDFNKAGNLQNLNWGDDLNWHFVREICKRPVAIYNRMSLAFRLKLKNYLIIGSTLDMLCKKNTIVWGAGLIYGDRKLTIKPKKVCAVRGPLTRASLIEQGIDCPKVYGDPALLLPLYYNAPKKKKYRFGFIPHVSNLREIKNIKIDNTKISEREDILIINLSNYNVWTDIIDQINSCEYIISNSLHGLIVSEAYKIPNMWVEFGNPLIGGHFKFHDFFLSIGVDRDNPSYIENDVLSEKDILDIIGKWKPGHIDLKPLISSCPFSISLRQ
jgi:pyruvyltransferase